MTRSPTRRRYLTASAAAAVTALAGCSDLIEDYDEAEDPDGNESEDQPVENVDHENPEGELGIVAPEDGGNVTSPVEIEMEVEDFELQPAEGESDQEGGAGNRTGAPDQGAGHLHVIVDEDCLEPGYPIPFEDGYHHLSDGGTSIELDLEPGEHDLCAQAGDGQHNAYDLTDEITIEVAEGEADGGEGGNDTGENATNESGNGGNGSDTDGE